MIRKEIRLRIIYGQPTAAYRRIADIVTGPVAASTASSLQSRYNYIE